LRTLKHETAADGTYFTDIYKECGFVRSITYTDVDGEENGGEFESQTVKLTDMDKLQLRKGEGWYNGVFKLSAEVKLKNKE
jgi:putative lipoprotein (rSAM/lipoprotein system)